MAEKNNRPKKISSVVRTAQEFWNDGNYYFSVHALDRQVDRDISVDDIEDVLFDGHHESKKDKFDEDHGSWCYAIRGETTENKELRVVITIEENMLIVTVIELD